MSKEIPLENIVGFCSDTTNVMMGSNHSVSTLLKDSLPHVIIVKCSCHIFIFVHQMLAVSSLNLETIRAMGCIRTLLYRTSIY